MSALVEQYIRDIVNIRESGRIDTDLYNNALSISIVLERLFKNKNINSFDVDVVRLISWGYSFSETADELGVDRKKVTASFKNTCNLIGYILGGEFTDTGFEERHQRGY